MAHNSETMTESEALIPSDDDDLLTEDIFQNAVQEEGVIEPSAEQPESGASATKIRKKSTFPRLNEERLCSAHGIPSLESHFQNVKFKGPGHEATNLKILLKQFEYWGNQLYPKYCFEDFVERVEDLGSKSAVKMCVRRLRRGEDESGNIRDASEPCANDDGFEAFGSNTVAAAPIPQSEQSVDIPVPTQPSSITLELRAKIQHNREIAMKRRAARAAMAEERNTDTNEHAASDTAKNDDDDSHDDLGTQTTIGSPCDITATENHSPSSELIPEIKENDVHQRDDIDGGDRSSCNSSDELEIDMDPPESEPESVSILGDSPITVMEDDNEAKESSTCSRFETASMICENHEE